MLGLPSTTEVNRRLPKEAFYRNLDLKPAVRRQLAESIERFTVRNSLKPSTLDVVDGERVHEILVVEVELRQREVPTEVLATIAASNANHLVFVCTYGDEACLGVMLNRLAVGSWLPMREAIVQADPSDMDKIWDTLASQVVYGDAGLDDETVEERAGRNAKIESMRTELTKLEGRLQRERQHARKNKLFAKMKAIEAQLAECEKGR